MEKVNGAFAIVFTCYNIRRAMSILSPKTLIERLKALKSALDSFLSRFFQLSSLYLHVLKTDLTKTRSPLDDLDL
jgi:hypothetical protein